MRCLQYFLSRHIKRVSSLNPPTQHRRSCGSGWLDQPFLPQLIQAAVPRAKMPPLSATQLTGHPCSQRGCQLQQIPAGSTSCPVHRGLAAPVRPDTPVDPISGLETASTYAATSQFKRNNRHERIEWKKNVLGPKGAGCLSKM